MSNEKDELLSKQYQSESNEQVPSALDLQILDMAKAELEKPVESNSQKPIKKHKVWPQMYATAAVMIIGVGLVTFMQREVPVEIGLKEPSPASDSSVQQGPPIFRSFQGQKAQPTLDNVEAPMVMDKKLLKQDAESAPRKKTHTLPSVSSVQQGASVASPFQEQEAPAALIPRETPMKQKSIAEEKETKRRSEPEKDRFEFYSIMPSRRVDSIESEEIQSPPIAQYTTDIKHEPIKSAKSGETIVHTFSITNEGTFDDVYSIEVSSNKPWINKRDIPETVSIASNETYLLTITSTIPATATKGTVLEIELRVVGRRNRVLSKEIVTETSIVN